MNAITETRRQFWSRMAIAEIKSARIWRKIGRMDAAKVSIRHAREWLDMARGK